MIRRYIHRHQPQTALRNAALAGLGAFIAVLILGGLTQYGSLPLMIAPFGASCVLLFAAHASPLSQPINVVGGHLVAAIVGVACHFILPGDFAVAAASLGLAVMIMMTLRVTHPPAGATVLVAYATATSWWFVILPVFVGSVLLVALGLLYHQLTDNRYPLAPPNL